MAKKDDQNLNQAADELQAKIKAAEAADKKQETALQNEQGQKDAKDARIAELESALMRTMADWQNFRRRNEEERGRFIKMAHGDLLLQLLPTLDNFHRSVEHLPGDLKENDWVKGVLNVHDEFFKTLERMGLKRIETVGKPLDTSRHEALMAGPGKQDEVTEELEPGYLYKNEVIKAAKVKVGNGSPAEKETNKNS